MIKGIGTDIIEVARFKKMMERHPKRFLKRLFADEEAEYCGSFKDNERHFSGRFSAKEAVAKALGTGFGAKLSFKDIIITNNEAGKPVVRFSDAVNETFDTPQIEISISHCKAFATATAIWF